MRHPLVRVVAWRLLRSIPLLFFVSALSFLLMSLTPGDVADEILGPNATPAQYAGLRHALGLNLPVYGQYWRWLHHALEGNLGTSLVSHQSVTGALAQRWPPTLSLMLGAFVVSVLLGVSFGLASALAGGRTGRVVDALALLGFSLPAFWIAAELVVIFAVKLGWLPATGYVAMGSSLTGWLRSIVLPVCALSIGGFAQIAKQTREAVLDSLGSEYIRMARANGVSRRSIVWRHALRNASTRIVTMSGLQAIGLLGGTILAESVFAIPGLGSLLVNSANAHDLPVVQGIAVYFTLMVVAINLVVDISYTLLNPRVSVA